MEYALVCVVAAVISAVTLFSGFGLGTVLMPVFALFFPVPVAVAATAVVHLANNVFKVALVGRQADGRVVLRFALPAAAAAIVGALLLDLVADAPPVARYALAGAVHEVTPVKLVVAVLIVGFAVVELAPRFEAWSFPARTIPLGGVLSGFFGGLSGHQGALRTAFLIRAGLSRDALIGTMVVSAVVVDAARLAVYGSTFLSESFGAVSGAGRGAGWLIVAGSAAALAGSFAGSRLARKVTMRSIRILVAILLLCLGLSLGAGVI